MSPGDTVTSPRLDTDSHQLERTEPAPMTLTQKPRRANRDGSVYFMVARQRWACAVTLPNGKRQVRTFKTEAEARRDLKDTLRKLDSGQIGQAKPSLKTADFLVAWLANVVKPSFKPLTHQTYEYIVKGRLIPLLGRVPLTRLGPEHVERLQATLLEQGLSINTIRTVRVALGAALSYAVDRELIPFNPVGKVKLPRSQNPDDEDREPRVFTNAEVERFLAAATGDEYEPMFRLMLATGLRPGEARGVRWQDIDLERRVLNVRRQSIELKGGRRQFDTPKSRQGKRWIPLLAPAITVLEAQRQRVQFMRQTPGWQEHDLIFPSADGRAIVARTVNMHMTALCKQAAIPHATPHTLRHSAATFLLGAGVGERDVQELMGHASSATTRLYQHVTPDMRVRAMERLDAYFKANRIMY
jgi:integrase